MRVQRWQLKMAATLTALTMVLYGLRWLLFPGPQLHNEMWRYLVDDVAFLFLQVLVVTLVIDSSLQKRAKDELRRKLNMVIGAFFSQTGTDLLGRIATTDTRLTEVRADLVPAATWGASEFAAARKAFESHSPAMSLSGCDLDGLRDVLVAERPHLLNLLSNQSLLEHETFTDLLWAVTHLAEELSARSDLSMLTNADRIHLEGDVKRAYVLLGGQWLAYLAHLKSDYPYLYSLALRTNPLDPSASPEVLG